MVKACMSCPFDVQLPTSPNTILLTLFQVENFGSMRYERSREAEAHGRVLTQEHEATNAEIAMSEGIRPQVCPIKYSMSMSASAYWHLCRACTIMF